MEPQFRVGDIIRVHQKILDEAADKAGENVKTRSQIFEGIVIAIKNSGNGKSFTVRKISADKVGVERIWPLNSPWIEKIEVKRKAAKIRKAKLYYLRNLKAKSAGGVQL